MPMIESKSLTDLYEIRRRINLEIKDLSTEERTAYFRRNAQAALAGSSPKKRTAQAAPAEFEERREEPRGAAEFSAAVRIDARATTHEVWGLPLGHL